MRFLTAFLLILFSSFSFAQDNKFEVFTQSCLDCFNFVAPSILGASNVSPAEEGLIVFDANIDKFRGYSNSTGWQNLTNKTSVDTISSTSTLGSDTDLFLINSTSGDITLTLPSAVGVSGKRLTIRKIDSSTNNVIVDPTGAETVDSLAVLYLNSQGDSVDLVSDGSDWISTNKVLNSYIKKSLINTSTTTTADTWVAPFSSSYDITLTPGEWEIGYETSLYVYKQGSPGSYTTYYGNVDIYNTTDSAQLADTLSMASIYLGTSGTIGTVFDVSRSTRVTLTASKTYQMRIRCNASSSTGACQLINGSYSGGTSGDESSGTFYAKRIR